jgi:hypothetical protein
MQRKTRLAADSGGGIFFWEASLDTRSPSTSLLAAIYNARPVAAVDAEGSVSQIDNTQIARISLHSLFHGNDMLSVRVMHPATVIVDIVNLKGQIVSTIASNAPNAGTLTFPLAKTISPGSYFVGVTAHFANKTQRFSRRIVVMK